MGDPTSKRGVSFDQIDSYMFQLAGEMVSARLELQQIGQRNETSSTSRIEDELKNLRSHTMYEKGYKEEYKETDQGAMGTSFAAELSREYVRAHSAYSAADSHRHNLEVGDILFVGTQTRGLGPYTLETAIGGRYAEYYGGWVWKWCAIAMWFNVRVYWSIPFGFKFNWPPMQRHALPPVVHVRWRAACTCDPARTTVQTIDRHLPGTA
eukprot:COSAG03_NODE_2467_length_2722_cov_15.633562_2_plen_209_part_00